MTTWKWHWEFAAGLMVKPKQPSVLAPRRFEAATLSRENLVFDAGGQEMRLSSASWFASSVDPLLNRGEHDAKPDVAAGNET